MLDINSKCLLGEQKLVFCEKEHRITATSGGRSPLVPPDTGRPSQRTVGTPWAAAPPPGTWRHGRRWRAGRGRSSGHLAGTLWGSRALAAWPSTRWHPGWTAGISAGRTGENKGDWETWDSWDTWISQDEIPTTKLTKQKLGSETLNGTNAASNT